MEEHITDRQIADFIADHRPHDMGVPDHEGELAGRFLKPSPPAHRAPATTEHALTLLSGLGQERE